MAPRSPEIKLIAHDYAGNGSYTLNWGDPYSELPLFDDMTWRQFAHNYMHGAEVISTCGKRMESTQMTRLRRVSPRKRGF